MPPAGAWAAGRADSASAAVRPTSAAHRSVITIAPFACRILPVALFFRRRRRRHRRELELVLGIHRLGAAARRLERQAHLRRELAEELVRSDEVMRHDPLRTLDLDDRLARV